MLPRQKTSQYINRNRSIVQENFVLLTEVGCGEDREGGKERERERERERGKL